MRRLLSLAVTAVLALLVLAAGGLWLLQRALADGGLTPRIEAALEAALGRQVQLGAVSLHPGLRPRITVADARIGSIPGGSRPDLARIDGLSLHLALLPLLSGRVEVTQLALTGADILLERDAAGRPNWVLGGSGGAEGGGLRVQALGIRDARIAIPDAWPHRIGIPALTLHRTGGGGTEIDGAVVLAGQPFTIAAGLGEWEGAGLPTLHGSLSAPGMRLEVSGTVPRSAEEAGWSLGLKAVVQSPASLLAWLAPGRAAPPVGALNGTAQLGPSGLTDLVLRSGPLVVAGVAVAEAVLRAPALDAASTLEAKGGRGSTSVALSAALPSLARMIDADPAAPLPVKARLDAVGARLTLDGSFARAGSGLALDVTLDAPHFAALGPVLGAELAALAGLRLSARASLPAPATLRLDALRASADGIRDMTGMLEVRWAPRLGLAGQLSAQRLDLDALSGPGPAPRGGQRAIPDAALPLQTLRAADATLELSAAEMQAGGVAWRDIETRLALANGSLALQPFAATIPGGRIAGSLGLDAAASPPVISLALRSEGAGIDLPTLGRALGRGGSALAGPAEIALELRGRGTTLRRIAATLSGEAGLSMVRGSLAWAQMVRVGPDLARALLPGSGPAPDGALRCAALRLSAEDGMVRSQALLVEGDFGRITGGLALNLRDETMAARLLPDLTFLGGLTVRAPVTIGGTFAAPRVGVEPGQALAQVIGDTVANRLWRSSTVEWLRDKSGGPPPEGSCEADLVLARLGRAGLAPAPAVAPVPLVPRELQGAAGGVARGAETVVGGVARGAETVVGGAARGAGDVLRGIGGVVGGAGGLLGGRRQ